MFDTCVWCGGTAVELIIYVKGIDTIQDIRDIPTASGISLPCISQIRFVGSCEFYPLCQTHSKSYSSNLAYVLRVPLNQKALQALEEKIPFRNITFD